MSFSFSSSSSPSIPIYFVDAFTTGTNSPFTGNPAAVCLLEYDDDLPDDIKQKIAAEVNLSETAFVSYGWTHGTKLDDAKGSFSRTIRWFTPTTEVPLCGHATLASAKALMEAQPPDRDVAPALQPTTTTITFQSSSSGTLEAKVDKILGKITLNFPSNPPEPVHKKKQGFWLGEMIEATLGKKVPSQCLTDVQYSRTTEILLLRLSRTDSLFPSELLAKVSPDFKRLLSIETGDFPVKFVIVTIRGVKGDPAVMGERITPHFYSRFFAPWVGVEEDPVTGLAHTILTPYWMEEPREERAMGSGTLFGRQLSSRGGNVQCRLVGDRVALAGDARLTIKGKLFV